MEDDQSADADQRGPIVEVLLDRLEAMVAVNEEEVQGRRPSGDSVMTVHLVKLPPAQPLLASECLEDSANVALALAAGRLEWPHRVSDEWVD